MPWRKRWIDPAKFEGSEEELAEVLARRGYEVWVSEISEYKPLFVPRLLLLEFGEALTRPTRVQTRGHVLNYNPTQSTSILRGTGEVTY